MSTDLTSPEATVVTLRRDAAMNSARRCVDHNHAESTRRIFQEWCTTVSLFALPADPDTVVMFIGAQADAGDLVASSRDHPPDAFGAGCTITAQHAGVMEVTRGIRRQR